MKSRFLLFALALMGLAACNDSASNDLPAPKSNPSGKDSRGNNTNGNGTTLLFDKSVLGEQKYFENDGAHPLFYIAYSNVPAQIFSLTFRVPPKTEAGTDKKFIIFKPLAEAMKWRLVDLSNGKEITPTRAMQKGLSGLFIKSTGRGAQDIAVDDVVTVETRIPAEAEYVANHLSTLGVAIEYDIQVPKPYGPPTIEKHSVYIALGDYCASNPENFFNKSTGLTGCQDPNAAPAESLSNSKTIITDVLRADDGGIAVFNRDEAIQACEDRGMHLPNLRELVVSANVAACGKGYGASVDSLDLINLLDNTRETLCFYRWFSDLSGWGDLATPSLSEDREGALWSSSAMLFNNGYNQSIGSVPYVKKGQVELYVLSEIGGNPPKDLKMQVRCAKKLPFGWKVHTMEPKCTYAFGCKLLE